MMLKMFSKVIFLLPFLFFLFSCAEENTTEPTEENLLVNTSFEKNGQASDDGWTLPTGSDFSTNVPPNGGSYSLVLEASQPPGIYAFIKVPVKSQYTINKLSFWAFSTGVSSGIFGKAILSLIRNGAELQSKSIQIDAITWQNYSIQDTFNVAAGDSFLVQFSGGVNQLFSAKGYFDLCQLQGIK